MNNLNFSEIEAVELARAQPAIDEYMAASADMLKTGMSLVDYVRTWRTDMGLTGMPSDLISALEKKQSQIGEPMNAANPLAPLPVDPLGPMASDKPQREFAGIAY